MTDAPHILKDFLASFCFAAEGDLAEEIDQLVALAAGLGERFGYWEIVYVTSERQQARLPRLAQVLSQIKNLRLIVVRDGTNFYRRRAIAVSEAIGDVVVLTSFAEASLVDPPACAEQAYVSGEIVLCRRAARLRSPLLAHWLLTAITSHRIDPHDLATIALPRTRLNSLALRPTLALDLRFEPKDSGERYARRLVSIGRTGRRHSLISDRFELLEQLILTSAPRMLRAYAALSAFVTILSFLYALYAVSILLFKTDMQQGWFSTAIVQSGSVGFIAIGMTVIALGLADIAERLSGRSRNEIVDELANTSFFGQTKRANVELTVSQGSTAVGAE